MKLNILLIACLFLSQVAFSQNSFWDKITVRKAYETKTDADSKPAIFSITAPKDSSASYLFNGGVGFDFFYLKHKDSGRSFENAVTGFMVYNRNTLIDKKQKNYKLGLSGGPVFDISQRPNFTIFGPATVQYLHDYIDTAHSFIFTNYWHVLYIADGAPAFSAYRSANHATAFNLDPHLGLEYQNVFKATSEMKKGYDVRLYFDIGANFIIKKKARYTDEEMKIDITDALQRDAAFQKRPVKDLKPVVDSLLAVQGNPVRPKSEWPTLVEFSVSYAGRNAFLHHNSNFDRYIPLVTAAVRFYPFKTESFSFGFSYNDGANPIDATPKQTYWLFSLTFKK